MLTKLFHNLDYKAGCECPRPAWRCTLSTLLRRPALMRCPQLGWRPLAPMGACGGDGGSLVGVVGCSGAGRAVKISVAVMVGGRALTRRALPRRC